MRLSGACWSLSFGTAPSDNLFLLHKIIAVYFVISELIFVCDLKDNVFVSEKEKNMGQFVKENRKFCEYFCFYCGDVACSFYCAWEKKGYIYYYHLQNDINDVDRPVLFIGTSVFLSFGHEWNWLF